MTIAHYETCLSDYQWLTLEPYLPRAPRRGRPSTPLRVVVNAALHVVKSGCPWRMLPVGFPPWKTVYRHFRRWSLDGTLGAINHAWRSQVRRLAGKRSRPTAAVIDSQTVRSDPHGGEVGYDAAKKTKGPKRFSCVDTLGLILDAVLSPANTPERHGARELLEPVFERHPWLRRIWVDGGFSGPELAGWARARRP